MASVVDRPLSPSIGESFFCWRHLIEGRWISYASTACSGSALQWFKNRFATSKLEKESYDAFMRSAQESDIGAGGLVFTPYLCGEYAPFFDINARGAFIGLSLDKEKKHLVRAVLEGVAFSLRHVLESFSELGVNSDEVRIGGGGSKSALWNQIKADVTGKILLKLKVTDVTCLGAAVLASVGVRAYPSVKEAMKGMVRIDEKVRPNAGNYERYSRIYEIYRRVYPSLKEIFGDLASDKLMTSS